MKSFYHSAFEKYTFSYRHIPHKCWQGAAFSAVNSFSNGIIFFLAIYLRHELDLSASVIGLIISFYGIGTIVGSILTLKLNDKFSSKLICSLSFLLKAVTFIILAKAQMTLNIIICVFFLGLTSYTFKTANTYWVVRQCTSEKIEHKALNLLYAASNFGIGVAATIISFARLNEFISLFYIFAVIKVFAVVALMKRGESFEEHSQPHSITVTPNRPVLIMTLVFVFVIGLMIAQISTTYPLYLYHAFPDLALKAVSIVSIIETCAIIIFQLPLLALIQKQNKVIMLGLGAFLYGLGLFILSFSSVYLLVILSCLIYVLGEMIFMSMAQIVCSKCAEKPKKAQITSLYQSVYASSLFLGCLLGGFIYSHGAANLLWVFSGILGLMCLAISIAFRDQLT